MDIFKYFYVVSWIITGLIVFCSFKGIKVNNEENRLECQSKME